MTTATLPKTGSALAKSNRASTPKQSGTRPAVFLTSPLRLRAAADRVAEELEQMGLRVDRLKHFMVDGDVNPELRQLVNGADAVIAVMNLEDAENPNIQFEIGVAMGAVKQVYVVVPNPPVRMPFSVPGMRVIPQSHLEDVARELLEASESAA